jgi:hypothetical protein
MKGPGESRGSGREGCGLEDLFASSGIRAGFHLYIAGEGGQGC